MKKSFLIIIGIVLFSTVLASSIANKEEIVLHLQAVTRFNLGDTFSQQEIDSLDFDAVDLKPRFLRLKTPVESTGNIEFYFDWLVLAKTGDTYKVEYNDERIFFYPYTDFADCANLSSKQICISTEIEPEIISQVNARLVERRQLLDNLKTKPPLTHIVTGNDFDFSSIGG